MKIKITALFICLLLVFVLTGCDNPISRFINQVEIGNTFSDFAPGYSDILEDKRSLTSRAERSLASRVSMDMEIEDIEMNTANIYTISSEQEKVNILETDEMTISIKLESIAKNDFVAFLTAGDVEDVREDLQEEWIKFDDFINQNITDVRIYHGDVQFDESPKFNSDTVSKIRSIINVSNNTGNLTAQIEMNINETEFGGSIKAGFIKSGDDWYISSIELKIGRI